MKLCLWASCPCCSLPPRTSCCRFALHQPPLTMAHTTTALLHRRYAMPCHAMLCYACAHPNQYLQDYCYTHLIHTCTCTHAHTHTGQPVPLSWSASGELTSAWEATGGRRIDLCGTLGALCVPLGPSPNPYYYFCDGCNTYCVCINHHVHGRVQGTVPRHVHNTQGHTPKSLPTHHALNLRPSPRCGTGMYMRRRSRTMAACQTSAPSVGGTVDTACQATSAP